MSNLLTQEPPGWPFTYDPGGSDPGYPTDPSSGDTSSSTTPTSVSIPLGQYLLPFYGTRQIECTIPVYCKVDKDGNTTVIWALCAGEIDTIGDVTINDQDPESMSTPMNIARYRGGSIPGAPQLLLDIFPDFYNDIHSEIAYLIIQFGRGSEIDGWPTVKVMLKGRKIYDFRTGSVSYSDNPFLIRSDYMTWKYGLNIARSGIDAASVIAAADYADSLDPNGVKRWQFNSNFTSGMTHQAILDVIDRHCMGGCWMKDGKYFVDCDRPKDAVVSFSDQEIVDFEKYPVKASDMTNYVAATFTDTSVWDSVPSADLPAPDLQPSDSIYRVDLDLTGFLSFAQTLRIQVQTLNMGRIQKPYVFTVANDKSLKRGQVFTLSVDKYGIENALFIATSVQPGQKMTTIHCRKYDPVVYSNEPASEPVFPDTTLPSPYAIPYDATGLQVSESFNFQIDNTLLDFLMISFSASSFPCVGGYEVYLAEGGGSFGLIKNLPSDVLEYKYGGIRAGTQYTIKVVTKSISGKRSAGITAVITPTGTPPPPTWQGDAALQARQLGQGILLSWQRVNGNSPAVESYVVGWEIRRGMAQNWETMSYVNNVGGRDVLSYFDSACPPGSWYYGIKAVDRFGQSTALPLYQTVLMVQNPFLQFQSQRDFDHAAASLTDAIFDVIDGEHWVYPSTGKKWSERFDVTKSWDDAGQPYPIGTHPDLAQPVPPSAELLSPEIDFGSILGGQFSHSFVIESKGSGATVAPKLLLSNVSGGPYTEFDSSIPFYATARYVVEKLTFAQPDDRSYCIVKGVSTVTIQADPKDENMSIGVGDTGTITVSLANNYSIIKRVTIGIKTAVRTYKYELSEDLKQLTIHTYNTATGAAAACDLDVYVAGI